MRDIQVHPCQSPALARPRARAVSPVQERFYIEDGWVFREHHGHYVECLCRSEDITQLPAAEKTLSPGVPALA
jgi:hypothetical protein